LKATKSAENVENVAVGTEIKIPQATHMHIKAIIVAKDAEIRRLGMKKSNKKE
jgi:hypothetical protein